MTKWAFISDFDGTISKKDFYWIIIEKYYPEGKDLFRRWKDGELKDIEFLSTVFSSIHQDEEQTLKDIHDIPIDEHAVPFINKVQANGADFYILSAGTDFYINEILSKYGVADVRVFSNKGYFKEKNVIMDIDPEEWHYSERYGIDKSIVLRRVKENYDFVFYYGDSEPDSHPAEFADITFAKDALISILREKNISCIPVRDFKDVERYLKEEGWLTDG
jgi:2-hydroxy-3-keto-5-methylthiopentenyl-1-phosphate phosphatase